MSFSDERLTIKILSFMAFTCLEDSICSIIWSVAGPFCVTGGGPEAQEMRKKPRRRMSIKEKKSFRIIFSSLKKPSFWTNPCSAGFLKLNNDEIVKSRHSRENGNPENSNCMKILDSCLRRNDRKSPFQTFYETINNCKLENSKW